LCGLRQDDVMDGLLTDGRLGGEYKEKGRIVIRLRKTKTGDNKSVEVIDEGVKTLLRQLVGLTPRGGRLFPFTADSFRRAMHGACTALGLSKHYVPHSLRHGGACRFHFILGWSFDDTMARGRWDVSSSTRGYLQHLRAIAGAFEVPSRVATIAAAMLGCYVDAFNIITW